MFFSTAWAQDAAGAASAGPAGMLTSFAPLVLIFVVFYFLLIRPQQKKAKQHREMLGNVRRGDRVVTAGGIIGTVSKVEGESNELTVEIAPNVKVRVLRSTISDILARTEPAKGAAKDKPDEEEPPAV